MEGSGEGNPLRFIDMIAEVGWMAKLRMAIGDFPPKSPRTTLAFALQDWCASPSIPNWKPQSWIPR